MEPKEGPEIAIIREVYEETGLEVEVRTGDFRVVHDLHPEGVEDICIIGVCRVVGGELVNRESEKCSAMGWQDPTAFVVRNRGGLFLPLQNYEDQFGLHKTWRSSHLWVTS